MSETGPSSRPVHGPTLELLRRQLAIMRAAGEAAREADGVPMLTGLAAMAAEATASDRSAIYLLDEGGTTLTLGVSHGYDGLLVTKYEKLPADGPTGRAMTTLVPLVMSAREWPAETRDDLVAEGFVQAAIVPLHADGQVLGALNLGRVTDRPFSLDDLVAAEIVAHELSSQLVATRLRAEAQRRTADLSLIHELGQMIAGELDLRTVLETGARHLARITDVPQTFLFLTDKETGGLSIVASNVEVPGVLGLRIGPDEDSLPMQAVIQLKPLLIEDVEHAGSTRFSSERTRRFGQHALMAIPLLSRGAPIGAVLLGETRKDRKLTVAVLERAVAMSNQLATAMANAQLVDDLRRSYRELEQAQHLSIQRERLAALGELAASVAHEVRNPLAVIFNSLASLERLLPASEDARVLHRIATEEARRLNGIVGELLAFARPTEPQMQEHWLAPVVSGAAEAASNALGLSTDRIATVLSPDLGTVPIDAQLVRQAVINLLVNALQAAGPTGHVELRTRIIHVEGTRYAEIEIENEGPAIAPDVAPQIFQPFFTTKATGAGLGLAIVKRIAEAHRGAVEFSTLPGGQTVFRLRLAAEAP